MRTIIHHPLKAFSLLFLLFIQTASFGSDKNYNSNNKAMPITWLYFESDFTDNQVTLRWATSTETPNNVYKVQRSADSKNYTDIGEVKGIGRNIQISNYQFTDVTPLKGISYYRIYQHDEYGDDDYSTVLQVTNNNTAPVVIYPNPVIDMLNVTFNACQQEKFTIEIINLHGTVMFQKQLLLCKGNNTIHENISTLPKGFYHLKINGSNSKTISFLKTGN